MDMDTLDARMKMLRECWIKRAEKLRDLGREEEAAQLELCAWQMLEYVEYSD